MIAYKICWIHGDYEDSIIIRGESIEELQAQAAKIIEARKPDDYWSELLIYPPPPQSSPE
jgi:ribosomal protein L6P/L9E